MNSLSDTTQTSAELALDKRIMEIGKKLFQEAKTRKSKISGAWWSSKLMEFALQNEDLKIQLFRFVDVLPMLRSSKDVGQHLKEYFNAPDRNFPAVLSWGASLASVSSIAAAASAMAIRRSVEDMARTFIAGQNPKEALKQVERFRKFGLAFTLDLLGESIVSETEADYYFNKYLEMIEVLGKAAPKWKTDPRMDQAHRGPLARVNISIKLSALYSRIDPIDPEDSLNGIRQRLIPLLQRAKAVGAHVNIDMEDYHLKDLTLQIFREIGMLPEFREWPDFGIVIQAYLKDSADDLDDLIEWVKMRGTPITVRLVKGAYWDYETIIAKQHDWPCPTYTDKAATDANFEVCAAKLMNAYPLIETAVASHNIRSVACTIALAENAGVPKNGFEIQTLYGMARPMKEALADDDYRIRVYMPFGELLPGMAYLVRRLLENTANESFLRQGFVEGVNEEKLLANPAHLIGEAQKSEPSASSITETFKNEPDSAFFLEETRLEFQQALQEVEGQFDKTYPLIINGQSIDGKAPAIKSFDPGNRTRQIGSVASADLDQTNQAIAAAKAASSAWSCTPVTERANLLRKTADLIRTRKHIFSAWEVYEAAKPWREADGDVAEAIDFLEYYATEAEKLMTPNRRSPVPGEIDEDYCQARGVTAVIAPWNFPLAILTGMTAAALATGNTVIMKPAEQTSIVAAKLMEVFQEAGMPPGVVNFLPGQGETVGAHLVTHPDVNLIAFTGSKAVGLAIHAQAAQTRESQQDVKKVICEMGGKNAIIVDSDADLDEAVAGVLSSAFGFAGQKCSACSRVIIVGNAYQPFVKRMTEAISSLHVAQAEVPGCQVPPVIDDESQQRILKMIEVGKSEADLAVSLDVSEMAAKGSFVPPTAFKNVPPQARIAQEEIFGPVLCMMSAKDFSEALTCALDVPYALTGGIYSRSPAHIAQAREEFRVGNLYINRNCTGAKVSRQPFGGFKMSGIGSKAGGPQYLQQFILPRTVTENTMRRGFAPEV